MTKRVDKLPFGISSLFKFVDDIIASVPANHTVIIDDTFNGFHVYLKFSIEMENNRSVPVLDTCDFVRVLPILFLRTYWYITCYMQ